MATITLTIPSAAVPRVVHALCAAGGYPNETDENAKKTVVEFIKATVRNVESGEAERAALAALAEPDTDGLVT